MLVSATVGFINYLMLYSDCMNIKRKSVSIVALVLALPVVGVTMSIGSCLIRDRNASEQVKKISDTLSITENVKEVTVSKNGHCLSGGGFYLRLKITNIYSSAAAAETSVFSLLETNGVVDKEDAYQKKKSRGTNIQGASGGATSIEAISTDYYSTDEKSRLYFNHTLQTSESCEVVSSKKVVCGKERLDRPDIEKRLYESAAVKEVFVSGEIDL